MDRFAFTTAVRKPTGPASRYGLIPGDHVRVWRGFYWHHAVVVGEDRVIEFGGGAGGGPVRSTPIGAFARGGRIELVVRGGPNAVWRAESQVGRSDFDLLLRNCEHFATWCSSGRWASGQVALIGLLAVVTGLVASVRAEPTLRV